MHATIQSESERKHIIFSITLVVALLVLSTLSGWLTQDTGVRTVRWHLIVPQGYEGMLAIHYQCPGGKPLPVTNKTIRVAFARNGVYCTSDDSFGYRGPAPVIEHPNGTRIPYVTDVYTYEGYGMCCESLRVIGGGTTENPGADLILGLYWVGTMQPRPRDESHIPLQDLELFLLREFGVRRIRPFVEP